jgi:hypothetical protein
MKAIYNVGSGSGLSRYGSGLHCVLEKAQAACPKCAVNFG